MNGVGEGARPKNGTFVEEEEGMRQNISFETTVFILAIILQLTVACSPVKQSSDAASTSQQSSQSTVDAATCKARFDSFAASQLDWYRQRTSFLPIEKIRSIYYQGSNGHAVVVVHGFNSSPHNQRDLILALAQKGYTVIAPLLTGYGVDAATSNKATFADWQKAVEDSVDVVRPCHSKVSLMGHSFGGSLVTHEVLSGRISNIAKVVSLAPFYKVSTPLLNSAVAQLSSAYPTLSTTVLKQYVDTAAYEFIIGGETGEADPSMPMLALQTVFDSQVLFKSAPTAKSATPILVVVSKADLVIENDYAQDFVTASFSNKKALVYPASLGIGHSFQRRTNNPQFDSMTALIAAHLSSN
jgi:alpha-beta hydrolase superfamily lysophospholipase